MSTSTMTVPLVGSVMTEKAARLQTALRYVNLAIEMIDQDLPTYEMEIMALEPLRSLQETLTFLMRKYRDSDVVLSEGGRRPGE
jgi:hypothetical protein